MRLAATKGKTLRELRSAIDSAEYPLWIAFYSKHGFPDQRLEAVVANGTAAICQTHGGKVRANDLIPVMRSETKKVLSAEHSAMILRGWAMGLRKGKHGQ